MHDIPKYLENKILYIVFECIWMENGIYHEYKFHSVFFEEEEAIQCLNKINKEFYNQHKIVKHLMQKNKLNSPLFWNDKYNCWTDVGAFTSVSIKQIVDSIN